VDDIGASLIQTTRKSLKHLVQETGVSKSRAIMAVQLLKLRPYEPTVIHTLQPRNPASKVHSCRWFLQSVIGDEIDPQSTVFSNEVRFHFQGYINTQSNHYWSSQNPHPTHEVPLHPAKVGVWCAESARRIVLPLFLNETINCERYLLVHGQHFQHFL
jgi:hypothetical protein